MGKGAILFLLLSLPFSLVAIPFVFIILLSFPSIFTEEWTRDFFILIPCSGGGWGAVQIILYLSVISGVFVNTQLIFNYIHHLLAVKKKKGWENDEKSN